MDIKAKRKYPKPGPTVHDLKPGDTFRYKNGRGNVYLFGHMKEPSFTLTRCATDLRTGIVYTITSMCSEIERVTIDAKEV